MEIPCVERIHYKLPFHFPQGVSSPEVLEFLWVSALQLHGANNTFHKCIYLSQSHNHLSIACHPSIMTWWWWKRRARACVTSMQQSRGMCGQKTHINQTCTVLHTGVGSHKLRQEQDDTSTVSDISRYIQKYPPDSLLLFHSCTLHPSSPFYGFCLFVGSSSCQSFGVCVNGIRSVDGVVLACLATFWPVRLPFYQFLSVSLSCLHTSVFKETFGPPLPPWSS